MARSMKGSIMKILRAVAVGALLTASIGLVSSTARADSYQLYKNNLSPMTVRPYFIASSSALNQTLYDADLANCSPVSGWTEYINIEDATGPIVWFQSTGCGHASSGHWYGFSRSVCASFTAGTFYANCSVIRSP